MKLIERYWSLDLDRYHGLRDQPYDELVRQVGNALEESVRLQMVSDVPVGAFLSGGRFIVYRRFDDTCCRQSC